MSHAVESNISVVRAYLKAVERLDAEAAESMVDAGIVQVERPNLLYRDGQVRGAAEMFRDLPKARTLLRQQSYRIDTIFGAGAQVAVEARWEGVLAVAMGKLAPGDPMVAHLCMVFTLADGRIVRQVNYDCYEPFR